jgi:chaperone required for assembly of F1-ATPase
MIPPQPASHKRFYKSAGATGRPGGAFAVELDGRPIKTPAGNKLAVPTKALAEAIADEWNAQGETIVPTSLPLTKLANSAIDGVTGRRDEVASDILRYAATDLVCYRASYPEALVLAQARAWNPILAWIDETYAAPFRTSEGIAHIAQPEASLEALGTVLDRLDAFKLAALHVMTALTGSALIPLAHIGGYFDTAAAWVAAHVDEQWQTSHWGQDFEAAQRQKNRLEEFENASRFFALSCSFGICAAAGLSFAEQFVACGDEHGIAFER